MKTLIIVVCFSLGVFIIGGIFLVRHWRESGKYSDIVK